MCHDFTITDIKNVISSKIIYIHDTHIWWYHLLSSNLMPDKLEPIRDFRKIVISPPKTSYSCT